MTTRMLIVSIFSIALALGEAHAAGLDLGAPASRTPYDPYLGPVWTVMHNLRGQNPSVGRVERLVRQASEFRYIYAKNRPYIPQKPRVTESTEAGDCKAKALWLAAKMRSSKIRYVIGKARRSDSRNHAWLMWKGPAGWLILDPSQYSRPLSPRQLSPAQFIPLYSYSPSGSYVHARSGASEADPRKAVTHGARPSAAAGPGFRKRASPSQARKLLLAGQ